MGLMLPVLLHSEIDAGAGFVLAHLVIAGAFGLTALLVPAMRPRVRALLRHRPRLAHLPLLGLGLALGGAMVCGYCLGIGGEHF